MTIAHGLAIMPAAVARPGNHASWCNKVKCGEYPALPAGLVADTVKKR
jgi:hypothetical protein